MTSYYIICQDRDTGIKFAVGTLARDDDEAIERFKKAQAYRETPNRFKHCAILGAVGGALAQTEAQALQVFEDRLFFVEDIGVPLTCTETATITTIVLIAITVLVISVTALVWH